MLQKLKSFWKTIFMIDHDAIKELNEILTQMRALSKEDRKLINRSLKK
jgi:hypothetical protein